MSSRWGACGCGLALALAPLIARAEPTAQDKALAETLFRDGRALVQAGKVAEGCTKLADSQHLDPQMGTLLNVALCQEQQGKTASAWAAFVEVSDASRVSEPARATFAKKHADDLEKKLSMVKLKIDPKTTDRVAVDGRVIASSALGAAFPLDPGDHTVDVSATGKTAFHTSVKVPVGPSTTDVVVPPLASESAAVTAGPVDSVTPPPREAERSNTKRTVGFVLGGVGLVGLGVGTAFGIMTLSKKSDADTFCQGDRCRQEGLDLDSEAMTSAVVSTIGFGVGLVGLGVGTYLVLTSKSSSSTTGSLTVAPMFGGTNGAQLQGRF